MGFFAGMLLCFSACLTVDGVIPRLVCLLFSLLGVFLGREPSRLLIPLFLCSAFLRLLPLGAVLWEEAEERGLILWALCAVSAAVLSFFGRARLSRAFVPCGLVLLPLLGFVMAGEWQIPALGRAEPREMLLALVCPLAGAFLLPGVQNRLWSLAGVLAGGVFGVLTVWVSFPVWEGAAAILCTVPCVAAELGMVWRPSAYQWSRRDANAAAKGAPAGDRNRK